MTQPFLRVIDNPLSGQFESLDHPDADGESVIQVHWVDAETGEIINRAIRRHRFLEYFANRTPCLIGMEACGGSQHWARCLLAMGHEVKLMPAKFVKAFNIGNKNDAADARAIWLAVQQPGKIRLTDETADDVAPAPAPWDRR
ncbi:hypothetical protein SAMN05444679_123128 [Variovorax sp. CF079]|nr:hypothetical protein SAMN05444679_123128 [Variovorax sp. CF079]